MRLLLLCIPALLTMQSACKPEQSKPAPETASSAEDSNEPVLDTEFKRDLNRICNGVELSGALELPVADQSMHTGIWLANNIESQEARIYSSDLKKLSPAKRVASLSKKIQEHGLVRCAILQSWN